jgi:hypothetical protein
MATVKLSTTLEEDLVEQVKLRVGPRGISSFVNDAVAEKLQKARVLEYLDELAKEHGPVSERDEREAGAELARIFRAH